jgi:pilus assembly protein CpaF
MSLANRLEKSINGTRSQRAQAVPKPSVTSRIQELRSEQFQELKTRIHDRLIDLMDLSVVDRLEETELRREIAKLVQIILLEEFGQSPLNSVERQVLISEIQDEVMGLGPLEPFLKDKSVNDILVHTHNKIYIERFGKLEETGARFKDDEHLRKIIDRIVSRMGRRIDESSPMVDARLKDGSRVNAIIPPLAIDGPSLSIRKFSRDPLEMEDLIGFGSITPEIGDLLRGIVRSKLNVIISGGTGSGKTTLLNVLSRFIPRAERVITIEDAAELQLKQEHVIRLETRPPNIEGQGQVTQRDLVRNSLRMRPDRIIVGEVRGAEALDMLQAMNTGHDGSLTTIHANTPRDALMRLETMVAMTSLNIPTESLRRYVSSAIHIIIQVARLADGGRKLVSFQEITGMEGEVITLQEIFSFRQEGIDSLGNVKGHFQFHGVRPRFLKKFESMGIEVSTEKLFQGLKSESRGSA